MHRLIALVLFVLVLSPAFARAEDAAPAKGKFFDTVSFEEGTFLGDANKKVNEWFVIVEAWREKERAAFKASLDAVEKERSANKDASSVKKTITIGHIILLSILLFIFSLKVAFYAAGALLAIMVVRRIFRFIGGLFRRRPEVA